MNVLNCNALDRKLKISPVTSMIVLHPETLHTHPDRVYSCDVFQQNDINSGSTIISWCPAVMQMGFNSSIDSSFRLCCAAPCCGFRTEVKTFNFRLVSWPLKATFSLYSGASWRIPENQGFKMSLNKDKYFMVLGFSYWHTFPYKTLFSELLKCCFCSLHVYWQNVGPICIQSPFEECESFFSF